MRFWVGMLIFIVSIMRCSKFIKKMGFKNIYESNPGKSKILEMQKLQHAIIDDRKYILDFKLLKKMEKMKINKIKYCGFDKISDSQLIVEATKSHDVRYSYDNEYEFNKNSRIDSIESKMKIYFCTNYQN